MMTKKYTIIGMGIVGGNLLDFIDGEITVIEPLQTKFDSHPNINQHVRETLNMFNYTTLLTEHSCVGSIIIDTAVNLDTSDLCLWCIQNNRHYINTVCDMWYQKTMSLTRNYQDIDNIVEIFTKEPLELVNKFRNTLTCLLGHGANIGMVNHFFKKALVDKAKLSGLTTEMLEKEIQDIYIIEKDTLVFDTDILLEHDIFYNTWNIFEFILESSALADYPDGDGNTFGKIPLNRDVSIDDFIVHGRLVGHEETYTISSYLKQKGSHHGKIQFIYECSPIGEISRIKFPFGSIFKSKTATVELSVTHGFDLIGCLVVFKDYSSWFCGYKMMQKEVANLFQTNATAWFVTCGVLVAIKIILKYPKIGVNFPENLDFLINNEAVTEFIQLNNPENFVSKEVKNFFISEEYLTYKVNNVH